MPRRGKGDPVMTLDGCVLGVLCDAMALDDIAGTRLWGLDCRSRSVEHSLLAIKYEGRGSPPCLGMAGTLCLDRNPSKAAYHAAVSRKWAEAAEHAWLPVAADPPEPD